MTKKQIYLRAATTRQQVTVGVDWQYCGEGTMNRGLRLRSLGCAFQLRDAKPRGNRRSARHGQSRSATTFFHEAQTSSPVSDVSYL